VAIEKLIMALEDDDESRTEKKRRVKEGDGAYSKTLSRKSTGRTQTSNPMYSATSRSGKSEGMYTLHNLLKDLYH